MATRVLAIDWSGARAAAGQRTGIWLAEASATGLARVEGGGWTRDAVLEHVLAEADRDPDLVVGLDFAFSLPAWYLRRKRLDARGLWARLAAERLTRRMRRQGLAAWLADPDPPFWSSAGGAAGLALERQYRRTELDLLSQGLRPKSVFQLVGRGQVGRASLHGMQALHRLAGRGFGLWPFDEPRRPLAVEIYPRALAPAVTRARPEELRAHLEAGGVTSELIRRIGSNEHAFDAAVSALVMAAHVEELRALGAVPGYELEGRIWLPARRLRPPSAARPRPRGPPFPGRRRGRVPGRLRPRLPPRRRAS